MSNPILDSNDAALFAIRSQRPGPKGSLPLTPEMLRERPSGDLFGWTQNAGMGWDPARLNGQDYLILSTHGGIRAQDGTPIALGYHTGHWEVGLLMQAAAEELKANGAVPFAAYCTDPCDGRSQGTAGMFDSLPYRNDAAVVFRRLIRSLPTRRGVIGVATCDKGLPSMMMALAGTPDLPCVLVPGGVTLVAEDGEDAGKVQTIGARFSHGSITLEYAADMGCRACGSPGGGCQFLGTAASSQVLGEALGMSLPHSALAPSGHPIWTDMARRSARAIQLLESRGLKMKDILTDAALRNSMIVHAAFGGSTNILLHLSAIAHAAGLRRPNVDDWAAVNRKVPRLVDALPNGPRNHPTVQVFLAGGVPEVMLHLRAAGLLDLSALTVTGETLGQSLEWWEASERRSALRKVLAEVDRVDPGVVIHSLQSAREAGLTSTVCFPVGNLAPDGSVIKSTSIDPSVIDADGVYRKTGPARVFTSEAAAIHAIKNGGIEAGDVIVLICRGPMGTGMEETYQLTSALKHLPFGKHVALLTDARFSGVSTGACIGHVSPEALAGGPVGKVRDGDLIEIIVNRNTLEGSINLLGFDAAAIAARPARTDLAPDPLLPADSRLWAALQDVSGGTWGGCVYDVDEILRVLEAGKRHWRADARHGNCDISLEMQRRFFLQASGFGVSTFPLFSQEPAIGADRLIWQRSKPDFAIYLPSGYGDRTNQQVVAAATPKGTLIVTWTLGGVEGAPDHRQVVSRSLDDGKTWSAPQVLDSQGVDKSGKGDGLRAQYGFPFVVPSTGRIYIFYGKNTGQSQVREDITAVLKFVYSDDDGVTWNQGATIPLPRCEWSHPDPAADPNWICIYAPILTRNGSVLCGVGRYKAGPDLRKGWQGSGADRETELVFFRFDNILTERDPKKLTVTVFPEGPQGLRIPRAGNPKFVWSNEPSLTQLSDGTIFCTIRTRNDAVYYTLSRDEGRTWIAPLPLRYRNGGEIIPNSNAPCPVVRLQDGRVVLMYYNRPNGSQAQFGQRDPVFLAVGRETLDKPQPVEFAQPRLFMDIKGVMPPGGTAWPQIASYSSFLEHKRKLYLFYNDSKYFILGKVVPEQFLQP